MSSRVPPTLSGSIRQGIESPTPPPPEFGNSLRHTPRYPDLAKLWRSGGAQRNAWIGALGVLAHQEELDAAVVQACSKLDDFEAHRLRQAVMDWSTSVYAPVQPPSLPLDPLEKSSTGKLGGPFMAELTLFGIPVLGDQSTIEELVSDNQFTSLLRTHEVFDKTAIVAFLGSVSAEHILSLSPQVLYTLVRALRAEMLNFWEKGTKALSVVAQSLVQTFLNENEFPPNSENEPQARVMLGIRLALCHKDGRAHDVLSERRQVCEDEQSLDSWHDAALTYVHAASPGNFLLGDPKPLGKTQLDALGILTEGRLAIWAAELYDSEIGKVELKCPFSKSLDSSKTDLTLNAETKSGQFLPPIMIPWDLVEPHYFAWKKRLDSRFLEIS